MTLKSKTLITPKDREFYAHSIAAMLNWRINHTDIPYKPNPHDDLYWTVDENNNWKVEFGHDGYSMKIINRYATAFQIKRETDALNCWLVARFYFEESEETA
jgi:hypothetical protein